MWETWVRSLGWGDLLEKGKATHSSILAWRIPWTVHGVTRVGHDGVTFTFTANLICQKPNLLSSACPLYLTFLFLNM